MAKEFICEECHKNCRLTLQEKPEKKPYICPVNSSQYCHWREVKSGK